MANITEKIERLKRQRDAISTQAMRTFDLERFKKLEKQAEKLSEKIWELESQLA